ncbi:uncharacterized protein K02A2.6-like [Coccinella septempunctata]|uniref:uncharacterized protein K02A2.6-like n=1 Tax=Coccinella septempunctata TaxID=41139 RepID=UPI001D08C66B|nr:uncharacterized protein K02A2.6-like [Coccinella septempunctata]
MPSTNEGQGTSKNASSVGNLREFHLNITDWNIYKARLNNYFSANEISDTNKQRAILLNMLDEEAYKLIFNICSPDLPEDKSYNSLLELFDKHFTPKKSVLAERYKFFAAKKDSYENIKEWAARIRSLAVSCEFGQELDICLRDRFVCGFEKGAILDRLLEEKKEITFEQAINVAENKMAACQSYQISGLEIKSEPLHHIRKRNNKSDEGKRHQAEGHHPVQDRESCAVCGKQGHRKDKCYFRSYSCNFCKVQGHLSNVCPQKQNRNRYSHNYLRSDNNVENKSNLLNNDLDDLQLYSINEKMENTPFTIEVNIESHKIVCQIDSGASVSCMSENVFSKLYAHDHTLKSSDQCLHFYNGTKVKPLGIFRANVEFRNIKNNIDFYVFKNGGPPIVGRDFLITYNMGIVDNVNFVNDRAEGIVNEFFEVFSDGLGKFSKGVVTINLKDSDVNPKFYRARPVPYVLKSKIEDEINRLVSLGVLYPVDYSEWGTPVVPVLKKNGSLRLCGDYKVTINPHIEVDQHPLPRIDDLFNCLQGGVKFSKLDLSDAYQQIGLDESSKELTTIVTHKGLYRYNRLTYGIASAPAKFQKIMESLFTGLEGVVVFLDDVLITGKDDNEHLERLRVVLTILKNSGLKVSRPKCKFFQDSIEYLGYIIDKEGLHTSESKTVAIKNAEAPTNVSELKSFLGMVNYYGRFIPNLSTILHPLYELLKKDKKWDWSDNCRKAFEQIKSFLASPRVLVHFDPLMKIKLTVDASPYGVAAVLSHILPTGIDRPIAFASRTLSNSEKNYSHIEKEGLAIIFAVLKFHQYLYANKFKLVTDNKALISIFGQHKPIPQFSANRLRRWAVILSNYQYEIEYVESKKNNADALSRLLKNHSENDTLSIEDKEVNYCNFLSNSDELPMNYNQIVRETKQDELIAKIIRLVKTGWPRYINDVDIKPFFSRRFEFSVVDNSLYWNHRIIIPSKLRSVFLKSLHQTHFGIVKMKNIARSHFWWPNLDKEIEDTVKKCHSCSKVAGNPPKVPLANWSWPKEVWERLHIDYLGPIAGKYYLIILDAHSKWPEVFETSSTNTEITIKILKQIFARFGLPVTLVSDNATYFKSSDFELFLTNNNISHKTIPPFHPQSNGAAENSVKLFKNSLKKAFVEGHPVDTNTVLCRFLLDYRTTKHCTTGETPAKIMFGRNIRTRFDAILYKPSSVLRNRVLEAQDRQKKYFKGNNHVQFLVGDTVLVKDYRDQNKPTWIKGIIQKKIGRVTFLVYIPELEKNWKRHANQLKKSLPDISYPNKSTVAETVTPNNDNTTVTNEIVPTRPKRVAKPPERYQAS